VRLFRKGLKKVLKNEKWLPKSVGRVFSSEEALMTAKDGFYS